MSRTASGLIKEAVGGIGEPLLHREEERVSMFAVGHESCAASFSPAFAENDGSGAGGDQ